MDIGILHGIATITAMVAFLGVCYWAYRPGNKKRFEEDGQSALDNDPIYQANKSKNDSGDVK